MTKIAVLLSGHIRNLQEHITNFKENLLNILKQNNYDYDIYIHTWDDNLTKDIIYVKDKFFKKDIILYVEKIDANNGETNDIIIVIVIIISSL